MPDAPSKDWLWAASKTYTLPSADPASAEVYAKTNPDAPVVGAVSGTTPSQIANAVATQATKPINAPTSTWVAPGQDWMSKVSTALSAKNAAAASARGGGSVQYQSSYSYTGGGPAATVKGSAPAYAKMQPILASYMGQNRYVYGGFDCSKFTQEVAAKAGYSIPRDTASQLAYFREHGRLVPASQMKPGDILYFRSKASGSGRHTGIYIGNGQMIDNSGSGIPIKRHSISGRVLIGVGRL